MAKKKEDGQSQEEVKKEDNSNKSAEKSKVTPKNVAITLDNSLEEVVKYNHQEGVTMFFDPNSFLELPENIVNDLGFYSAQSYFQAKQAAEARKRREELEKPLSFDDLKIQDPLADSHVDKLKLRKRRGWHQTWKRPDEFERAKEQGYRQIREAKGDEEPGYETGDVKKIYDEYGKVELVAMEIPEEIIDKHTRAVENRVRYRKGAQLEKMEEQADRASYALGKKGSVQIKDFSQDESDKWRDIE